MHINETVVDSGLFHGDLATGKSRGESSSGLPGAQALAKIYVDHLVGDSSPTLKWKLHTVNVYSSTAPRFLAGYK